MIIANSFTQEGAGFGVDTNKVYIITKDECKDVELMSKEKLADVILDEILYLLVEEN